MKRRPQETQPGNNDTFGTTKDHIRKSLQALLGEDAGFALVVGVLKARREDRKISVERLSRLSGVSVGQIQKLEAADFNSARLKEMLMVAQALKCHVGVALVPVRENPPRENTAVLAAFDKLLRSRKALVFVKNQPDRAFTHLLWTVIGDRNRNWLFVACNNPRRNVRFAAVTANPGGWPLRSQWVGMDAETRGAMNRMSQRLVQRFRKELL